MTLNPKPETRPLPSLNPNLNPNTENCNCSLKRARAAHVRERVHDAFIDPNIDRRARPTRPRARRFGCNLGRSAATVHAAADVRRCALRHACRSARRMARARGCMHSARMTRGRYESAVQRSMCAVISYRKYAKFAPIFNQARTPSRQTPISVPRTPIRVRRTADKFVPILRHAKPTKRRPKQHVARETRSMLQLHVASSFHDAGRHWLGVLHHFLWQRRDPCEQPQRCRLQGGCSDRVHSLRQRELQQTTCNRTRQQAPCTARCAKLSQAATHRRTHRMPRNPSWPRSGIAIVARSPLRRTASHPIMRAASQRNARSHSVATDAATGG